MMTAILHYVLFVIQDLEVKYTLQCFTCCFFCCFLSVSFCTNKDIRRTAQHPSLNLAGTIALSVRQHEHGKQFKRLSLQAWSRRSCKQWTSHGGRRARRVQIQSDGARGSRRGRAWAR